MKKITTILLGLTCSITTINAQTNIADARTFALDSIVTVTGIVTNGAELGSIRYIEDGTAGIACYPGAGSVPFSPNRGDSITVTGTLKDYNGLLEIDPITAFTINSTGNTLPTPQLLTPNQIGEMTEAELIQIDNVVFDAGGSNFASGTYSFTSNTENGVIYVSAGSPLAGDLIPLGEITLIGISSQYTFNTGGYQILPRDSNDIVSPFAINFASNLIQTNITTTSFDLSWNTDVAGTSNIMYGITPSLELPEINLGDSTTTHVVPLTGLTPATIYYVRAYSTLGPDTVLSSIRLFSTASNSSGEIIVYFNRSVDTSVSTGTDAIYLQNTFNDTISAYIDRANSTIDLCIYNNSNAMIVTAINDAYARGVDIRYITESQTLNTELGNMNGNINVLERINSSGSGIMHNKFVIIDVNSPDSSWVLTGSTNWTSSNLFNDYNNMIIVQDQALARAFELEFEEMWGDTGLVPNGAQSKFGSNKTDNTPHQFIVGGKEIELYFSPTDQTTNAIVNAIATVDYSMEFAILSFTKNELGVAVKEANDKFGVNVRGIIESTNDTGEEFTYLTNEGVDVLSHLGIPYSIHHKYAIIDQLQPLSDPMVITGSHNWSASAENNNDENTLIVHDATIANIYYQEFMERYCELVTSCTVSGIEQGSINSSSIQVFPNPNNGIFTVEYKLSEHADVALSISDLTGRIIYKETLVGKTGINQHLLNQVKLSSGIYFLKIIAGENIATQKLIRE